MTIEITPQGNLWSPWVRTGERILALRKERQLSRAYLAQRAEVDERTIELLERGLIENVNALMLAEIARTLGVRLIELLPKQD